MIYELAAKEVKALRKVVQYLVETEEEHYYTCEPTDRKSHVFKDVKILLKIPFIKEESNVL